eukprot:3865810-Pyramimonas_sp.AAC.1
MVTDEIIGGLAPGSGGFTPGSGGFTPGSGGFAGVRRASRRRFGCPAFSLRKRSSREQSKTTRAANAYPSTPSISTLRHSTSWESTR